MQPPTPRSSPEGGNNFLRLNPTMSETQPDSPAAHLRTIKRPFGGAETPGEPLTKHARLSQNGRAAGSKGKQPATSADTPPEKLLQFSKYMSTLTPPAKGKGKGKANDPTPSPLPAGYFEPNMLQDMFEKDLRRHQAQLITERSPPNPALDEPFRPITPPWQQKPRKTLQTSQSPPNIAPLHNDTEANPTPTTPIPPATPSLFSRELLKRTHIFEAENANFGHRPSSSLATKSSTHASELAPKHGNADPPACHRLRDEVARMRNAHSNTYAEPVGAAPRGIAKTIQYPEDAGIGGSSDSELSVLMGVRSPRRSLRLRERAGAGARGCSGSEGRRQGEEFGGIEVAARVRDTAGVRAPGLGLHERGSGGRGVDKGGFEGLGVSRRDRVREKVDGRSTSPAQRERHLVVDEGDRERFTRVVGELSLPPRRDSPGLGSTCTPPGLRTSTQSHPPRQQQQPGSLQATPPSSHYPPSSPHLTATVPRHLLHTHVHTTECERFTPDQHIVLYDLSISLCEQRASIAELKLERARVVFGGGEV